MLLIERPAITLRRPPFDGADDGNARAIARPRTFLARVTPPRTTRPGACTDMS
jgi:hypothetical protein